MVQKRIILKKLASHALSGGAMNESITLPANFKLLMLTIKFAVAVTETVTVNRDSADGANYDTQLDTSNLSNSQNYVFRPTGECVFCTGDAINITCTAASATTTGYITAILEDLGG